jgi:hypothetical protein
VILCLAASSIVAFEMSPKYKSSVIVIPVANTDRDLGAEIGGLGIGGIGGLASLAGINLHQSDARTEEALAILESRDFADRFIQTNNLLPVLFAAQWDPELHRWKASSSNAPTLDDAWKLFNKRIRSVYQDTKTGLITVSIEWRDPADAANWANSLIAQLNSEMRARAIASSDQALRYLIAQLNQTRIMELRNSIEQLIEMEQQKQMLATVSREYVFRTVDSAMPSSLKDPVITRRLVIEVGLLLGLMIGILGAMFDWI